MFSIVYNSRFALKKLASFHFSIIPLRKIPTTQPDNNVLYPSMTNITDELSDVPVGVGTALTKIKIQNLTPVTIADQLHQIRMHITQINKETIQIHHDIARLCVDLPYLFRAQGWELWYELNRDVNNKARVLNSDATKDDTLEPLLGINNKPIPDFPKKISDIAALDSKWSLPDTTSEWILADIR